MWAVDHRLLCPCTDSKTLFLPLFMKPVTPTVDSPADHAARERIRHRRRANQFTVIACLFAAGAAVLLGLWLPTLAE